MIDDLNPVIFEKYRGALLMKAKHPDTIMEAYVWNGQWFYDVKAAKSAVDEAFNLIEQSIKVLYP